MPLFQYWTIKLLIMIIRILFLGGHTEKDVEELIKKATEFVE